MKDVWFILPIGHIIQANDNSYKLGSVIFLPKCVMRIFLDRFNLMSEKLIISFKYHRGRSDDEQQISLAMLRQMYSDSAISQLQEL